MISGQFYAHSLKNEPLDKWEPLDQHQMAVAQICRANAEVFGWSEVAALAGQLHDIGKLSAEFQAYIRGEKNSGGDHSTAGARIAAETYPGVLGRILAFIIAGHHAGLADGPDLLRRLDPAATRIPDYSGWRAFLGSLPDMRALAPSASARGSGTAGFSTAFLIRMLFSCLVDADFIATERFYASARQEKADRGSDIQLKELRDRLQVRMGEMRAQQAAPLNTLRNRVLDHALEKAVLEPGLFSLTVPTGGGKTLTSLSFALEHAVRHGLRRVIYVIPYTSIIEQTAQVFEQALGGREAILEHHASFDWDAAVAGDDEGRDGLAKLRRASENWDMPIVVTTAVQFFESLFANRTSRCRKLHNIAGSVVVLDEVQTLPLKLLRPCIAALNELACNYRTSVVLCTATQPALRKIDGGVLDEKRQPAGFDFGEERELAPDPKALYQRLKRVRVERLEAPAGDDVIAERFGVQERMLCIVNSRAHARDLFERIRHLPGAYHLTTLMCPRHRRGVLAEVRERLKDQQPVRLVATSLIEAGVDVDFPEVWRAATGLDSIAQAAGRCNREGRLDEGRVVVFEPSEHTPPRSLVMNWQAAQAVFRQHPDDPLGLAAVHLYFRELYWTKQPSALDGTKIDGKPGILAAISERANSFEFPFASIADAFRMIDQAMDPVIVPWQANEKDDDAERLLARIAASERPLRDDLRRVQHYIVPVPKAVRADWLAQGVLREVHPDLGNALLRLESLDPTYDAATGLRLDAPAHRDAESNIIS